ncbi:CvfB family protein [Fulvivirga sediminis]|uniref:GntR family transcriptional regulator n=1 Tax=Fulvivirga sediminis TaxID=2803949 RepID=A0A937FAW9_9BACT|nr:S1-like domain-containing RNA-binding protein [Fulvivirga sediminis]MBL3658237.1 GntR family transcriptional regulator [Fulvivirga sediminis]
MEIGKFYELEVVKELDFGVYLKSDFGEILLPTKYVPESAAIGDVLNVFVHRDSEDRLLATTLRPKGVLGEFVGLKATDITYHGAFMDWGLEKDLFVPKSEQHIPFVEGKTYVVRICMDYKSDRLVGVSKINAFLKGEHDEDLQEGDEVDLIIYNRTDVGYAAVINQKYKGLIYENEVFEPMRIGDAKKGYIKKLREDGKIDLSLSAEGKKAIDHNSEAVLEALKSTDGFLPYHDKSDADDIKEQFNMSKKAFKKAIGSLYKERLITIEQGGIRLS